MGVIGTKISSPRTHSMLNLLKTVMPHGAGSVTFRGKRLEIGHLR